MFSTVLATHLVQSKDRRRISGSQLLPGQTRRPEGGHWWQAACACCKLFRLRRWTPALAPTHRLAAAMLMAIFHAGVGGVHTCGVRAQLSRVDAPSYGNILCPSWFVGICHIAVALQALLRWSWGACACHRA
jgi:hypothetical protein